MVMVDPVTDTAAFNPPPDAPGAALIAGPRTAEQNPRPPVPTSPLIVMPPAPGTIGRLKRMPGGKMIVTPTNFGQARAQMTVIQPPNTDPPPGIPVIQTMTDGSLAVAPLASFPGYAGMDDAGPLNAACLQATGAYGRGGLLRLLPADYNLLSQWQIGQQATNGQTGFGPCSVYGIPGATRILVNYNATLASGGAVNMHRTSGYGQQFGNPADPPTGSLKYLIIDGTNAGNNAALLSVGDGWGYEVHQVYCDNAAGNNSVGAYFNKQVFWSEKDRFLMHLRGNTIAGIFDTQNADVSHEYNWIELFLFCNAGQQGIILQNGVNLGGVNMWLYGNMSSANDPVTAASLAVLNILGANSRLFEADLHFKSEANPGNGDNVDFPSMIIATANSQGIKQCCGRISGTNFANSQLNGAEFSFRGLIAGDPALAKAFPGAPGSNATITTQPPFPGFGVQQQNYGPDFNVTISGGGTTSIAVGNVAAAVTSGTFFVPGGGSITVNGAGAAPTVYTWSPAALTQF